MPQNPQDQLPSLDQTQSADNITTVTLYGAQADFVEDPHKYVAFIAGRGAGKSFAGCVKDIAYMWEHPGAKGYICAPTFPILRDATVPTLLELLPRQWVKEFNRQEMRITLTNGSVAYFRSLDSPDFRRGPSLAFIHIDEAAYVHAESWGILLATLRQRGYPVQAWTTSTPRLRNWIWETWVANATDKHKLYRARSSDNKTLPDDFEDFARGKGDNYFRQEVLGEFVGNEGLVYPAFSRTTHLAEPPQDMLPRNVVAGIDWGFRDPAVIVVIQDFGEYGLYIPEVFHQTKITVDDHAAVAEQLRQKYKINRFYCDPSRPDSIESFRRRGISAIPANNDILTGIQEITGRLHGNYGEPSLHFAPGLSELIREFEVYCYPENQKPNKSLGETPVDKDNHVMDALRYGAMALSAGDPPLLLYLRDTQKKRIEKLIEKAQPDDPFTDLLKHPEL